MVDISNFGWAVILANVIIGAVCCIYIIRGDRDNDND